MRGRLVPGPALATTPVGGRRLAARRLEPLGDDRVDAWSAPDMPLDVGLDDLARRDLTFAYRPCEVAERRALSERRHRVATASRITLSTNRS